MKLSDPCPSGTNACENGGICSYNSAQGTYFCRCTSIMFSGQYCEIDECLRKNCPANSECTQDNGKTACRCRPGFKGKEILNSG